MATARGRQHTGWWERGTAGGGPPRYFLTSGQATPPPDTHLPAWPPRPPSGWRDVLLAMRANGCFCLSAQPRPSRTAQRWPSSRSLPLGLQKGPDDGPALMVPVSGLGQGSPGLWAIPVPGALSRSRAPLCPEPGPERRGPVQTSPAQAELTPLCSEVSRANPAPGTACPSWVPFGLHGLPPNSRMES